MSYLFNPLKWCCVVFFMVFASGCATVMPDAASDPRDPFEGYNRTMYSFNQVLDKGLIRPVATVYSDYMPNFIQKAIGNFFSNIGDIWTAANNLLQGKPRESASDLARVLLNTTFGIAGLIDVGSHMGLDKHDEDFGQTLAVWGVKSGPYVVLPIFGSSTLRDSIAKPVDLNADPVGYIDSVRARNTAIGVRLIDDRAALLPTSRMIDSAALDPYLFVRDAYLQRRASRIRDGAPDPDNKD